MLALLAMARCAVVCGVDKTKGQHAVWKRHIEMHVCLVCQFFLFAEAVETSATHGFKPSSQWQVARHAVGPREHNYAPV